MRDDALVHVVTGLPYGEPVLGTGALLRVATWNLERKKPHGPRGRAGIDHLFARRPGVMAVTETWSGFPSRHGHVVCGQPLPYDHVDEDERRVLLWSAFPWTDVDDVGDPGLPVGRFVAGTTQTAVGEVRFIGVCIPWHMSNVSVGTCDKRAWEDHFDYLALLRNLIDDAPTPIVVAGDFNQRVPRVKGRHDTAAALERCFQRLTIHTAGAVEGAEEPLIDHIATTPDLTAVTVRAWGNAPSGTRISDHAGVAADFVRPAGSP